MSNKGLGTKLKAFLLSYKFWWLLVAVVLLSRIPTMLFPYDSDHWIFYYVGKHWFDGGTLYLTVWDHKAPVVFAINGLMSWLFGDNILLHRALFTLLAALSVWLFFATTKRFLLYIGVRNVELSSRLASLVFAFWVNLSQFTNSGNSTENYGVLVLLLSLYCYLRFRDQRHWKWLLYSGAAISILVFLKINFSILVLPLIIDFIRQEIHNVKKLLAYGLVWISPTLLQIYFWATYFNGRKTLPDAIIASLTFNSKYLLAGWAGNLSGQFIFIALLGVSAVFFLGFILKAWKGRDFSKNKIILISTMLSAVLFSVILGTFYSHYYLIVMPYLCLLVAVYWREVISSKILLYSCIISAILSLGISTKQLYNNYYGSAHQEYIEMKNAAQYINQHTTSNDKIIYYGYGATFYELSHRDSGSRFISASHPLIDEREGFGYKLTDKYLDDMTMSVPKYIIVNLETKNLYYGNTRVKQYFESRYKIESTMPGYEILVKTN